MGALRSERTNGFRTKCHGLAWSRTSDDSLNAKAPAHKHARIVRAQQTQGMCSSQILSAGLIAFFIFAVLWWRKPTRPFRLARSRSELTAGFHTEYSGFRWSLIFLAEYSG